MRIHFRLFVILLASCCFGQVHTTANLDTDNVFTGVNTFFSIVNTSLVPGNCVQAAALGALSPAAAPCLGPPGVSYVVTANNWSQASSAALTAGSPGSVVLTPCPAGVDYTSGAGYQVYINDGASSEAVAVTSGSTGSGNCSITFTPFFSHTSYTIGSASSGIQETLNVAGGVSPSTNFNSQANVTIPANGPFLGGPGPSLNTYETYGTIFFHANQSKLYAPGVSLRCHGRGPCLQVGDQVSATHYNADVVEGINFRAPDNHSSTGDNNPAYNGCAITQTQATTTSGVTTATITTAVSCGFRPGDLGDIQFTDDKMYWGDFIVATASGTSFTFTKHNLTAKALQNTPGVVALSYEAILDNAQGTHFVDIQSDFGGELGSFNHFFDFWDDEKALVDHYNNSASNLTANVNWTGSFIYSGGGPLGPAGNTGQQWAPVITVRDSSITANGSNCVTADNSNGVYFIETVCQSSGLWEVKVDDQKGNFQGAYLANVYSESNATLNPLSPPRTPFPGLGIAGLIAGFLQPNANLENAGGSSMLAGAYATGGAGATPLSYFIVANDTTANTQTSPMRVLDWLSTGSDAVAGRFPRVANGTDVITYDVVRMTTPTGVGAVFPYNGGCTGGAGGICGSISGGVGIAQCSGLVCTFSDNGGTATAAYTIKQGTYQGQLNFWPGAIVTETKPLTTTVEQAPVTGVGLGGGPAQISNLCTANGATSSGGYTACFGGNQPSVNNSIKNQTALLLADGPNSGGGMALTKGRLNFTTTQAASLAPHHIITLVDSQPALTQATVTYRPPASVDDVWVGTDGAAGGFAVNVAPLAFGVPASGSISYYFGNTGDGLNWKERLASGVKTFAVPVRIVPGLFSTLTACAGGIEGEHASVTDSATNTWGATVTGGGSNHISAYCDGTNWTVEGK